MRPAHQRRYRDGSKDNTVKRRRRRQRGARSGNQAAEVKAFDHLVPADDPNSEVLTINIIEVDNDGGVYADGGKYANEVLLFSLNPTEYTGKKVLAVPRCCQHKKGTQDRGRVNGLVAERDRGIQGYLQRR